MDSCAAAKTPDAKVGALAHWTSTGQTTLHPAGGCDRDGKELSRRVGNFISTNESDPATYGLTVFSYHAAPRLNDVCAFPPRTADAGMGTPRARTVAPVGADTPASKPHAAGWRGARLPGALWSTIRRPWDPRPGE